MRRQQGNTTDSAHTWMVGYTRALAAAVWLGTTDGKALVTSSGSHSVFAASFAAPIWRQFMVRATETLKPDPNLKHFEQPIFPNESPSAASASTPPPSPKPTPSKRPQPTPTPPTPQPTCQPGSCRSPNPNPSGTQRRS
jgi:membrane peptidoglycan carboxypeptidase